MPEAPPRRSRFDRGGDPPEPTRGPPRRRFDTSRSRSRSPRRKEAAPARERSPVARARSKEATDSPSTVASVNLLDPTNAVNRAREIAAAVAARKKTAQPVTPTVVRPSSSSRVPSNANSTKSPSEAIEGFPQAKYYQEAGDHVCLIEINDLRNKYTLTKGDVHKQIHNETGADVTQKGQYYPDKSMATPAQPPLQLQITATTHESMYAAVMKIKAMIDVDLPKLVDERRFRRREPENVERDEFGRRKWPEEKLPIDLEPISGFNLRAQVVGRGGDNVKYIQTVSGCKVQIKGRGSGFAEHSTNAESDEPMYLHIAGPKEEGVAHAKNLCEQLLEKVRNDYEEFKKNPPQRRYQDNDRQSNGRPGYGDRGGHGSRGGGYGERRTNSYSNGNSAYGTPDYGASYSQPTAQSPIADTNSVANPALTPEQQAQWTAYYQQMGQGDPYAAYGGYEAYTQMYTQYYANQGYAGYEQQQQQQAGPPGAAPPGFSGPPGGHLSAPPPPPSEPGPPAGAPPPPPPPDSPPPPPPY